MWAAIAGLVAGAPRARADEGAKVLAKVAVIVLPAEDKQLAVARQATVQLSMERAVAADARLDVVDQDEALADSAGQVPQEAVAEARAMVASGEELLRRGQARSALMKLEGAATQLAGVLAWAQKQELAQAQFLRGASHAVLGEDKAALDEFVALLAWRPDFAADPTIEPRRVIPLWEKAQQKARRLPGGSVEVTSQPTGAMAYVDGSFVGFTPTTVEALAVGTHYLTVRLRGHQKAVVPVKINDRKAVAAAVTLTGSPRADQLDEAVKALRGNVGAAQAPADLQATLGDLSDLLGVDQLVVLLAPASSDKPYRAYVYAAVGGKRLAQAETIVGERDLEEAFGALAAELYKQVSFAPPPPPPPKRHVIAAHRPFWKTWWFWSSVGALVAGGVATSVVLGRDRGGPECPDRHSCGLVIFSF